MQKIVLAILGFTAIANAVQLQNCGNCGGCCGKGSNKVDIDVDFLVNVEPGVEVSANASADEGPAGPTEEEDSAATTGAEQAEQAE